jgi:histidinol-phosphatase (PHP family)
MLILKERYKDKITLAIGAEFGYSPEASDMYSDINAKYPNLDIVINSVHTVNCRDAYFPDFFDGLSKESAYLSYLDAVKNSIDAPYDYNVIAHIGYVTRNAPYLDKAMKYNDYKDIIDEILLNIINKNKALEVNSRSVSHDSPFMPSKEILVRYKELKGEMVTFASDAHIAADAGKGYKDVTDFLTKIGYKHLTAFVQRKPVFYDI